MTPRARGASLFEALVALFVSAAGLLALAGQQLRLRHGAELARQDAEAAQLAQAEIEGLRGPWVRHGGGAPGVRPLDALVASDRTVELNGSRYRLIRTVEPADTASRWVRVQVEWWDRQSDPDDPHRLVQLALVTAQDPRLIALAYLPP